MKKKKKKNVNGLQKALKQKKIMEGGENIYNKHDGAFKNNLRKNVIK